MSQEAWHWILALLLALVSADTVAVRGRADEKENPWAPYVEANGQVRDAFSALRVAGADGLGSEWKVEHTLKTLAARWGDTLIGLEGETGGRSGFVLQLFYFIESDKSLEQFGVYALCVRVRNLSLPDFVAATARFLESDDTCVRAKAQEFLLLAQASDPDDVSVEQARDRPDFTVPADVFRRQREGIPQGLEPLARHMFAKDPEQALRRLADVYLDAARRDELAAMLDDAKAGKRSELDLLRLLGAPDRWWSEKWFVQLYVAEKVCSDKALADEDVLKRLRATEHLIVWQRLRQAEP